MILVIIAGVLGTWTRHFLFNLWLSYHYYSILFLMPTCAGAIFSIIWHGLLDLPILRILRNYFYGVKSERHSHAPFTVRFKPDDSFRAGIHYYKDHSRTDWRIALHYRQTSLRLLFERAAPLTSTSTVLIRISYFTFAESNVFNFVDIWFLWLILSFYLFL